MKTLLSIALVVVLGTAHAQRVVGIRGGVNLNNIANSHTGGLDESNQIQSFHAGLMANIPFTIFSFQPSLLVTGKGARVTYGDENGSGDYFVAETNPLYLQVPATINLNLRFGDLAGFYIGAGPYAAMGIGGSNRVHGRREGTEFAESSKIRWSDDDPATLDTDEGAAYGTYRKFDYGATFNAGVFLTRIHVGVFYDHGLTKINTISNAEQNDSMRLRTLGFTAGFVFGS
jgi:hypothetical protein